MAKINCGLISRWIKCGFCKFTTINPSKLQLSNLFLVYLNDTKLLIWKDQCQRIFLIPCWHIYLGENLVFEGTYSLSYLKRKKK